MLKLPFVFTTNEQANELIRLYLTERILDLVDEVIDTYAMNFDLTEKYDEDFGDSWIMTDPGFTEEIRDLFPKNYPEEEMASSIYKLKAELEAEEEHSFSRDIEYVICRLFVKEILLFPDDTLLPMEGRDYVYYVLRLEEERFRKEGRIVFDFDEEFCDFAWTDELKKAREEGRTIPSAFYILNHLEDMRFYPSFLFQIDEGEMAEEFMNSLLNEMEMAEVGDWEEDDNWDEDEDDILPFDLTWNRKDFLNRRSNEDDDFLPF